MSEDPKWTVTTREKETIVKGRLEPEITFIHTLKFEGRRMHSLTGDIGKQSLDRVAEEFNRTNYAPTIVNVKLLMDLSQAQREKLAFLFSPELPFNAGGDE